MNFKFYHVDFHNHHHANLGVRFDKYMISTINQLLLEEPSQDLIEKLAQDKELFDQVEWYNAIMDNLKLDSSENRKYKWEEWIKIEKILDKHPEVQDMKKRALEKNGLDQNSSKEMIEATFTYSRLQRLRLRGKINWKSMVRYARN